MCGVVWVCARCGVCVLGEMFMCATCGVHVCKV